MEASPNKTSGRAGRPAQGGLGALPGRDGDGGLGWFLEQRRRGRLWLLVGYAPRTGKTRRLLEIGDQLRRRGLEAVLAYLAPRDMGALQRLAPGLAVIPPRRVEYMGMAVEEMDLKEALARRPPAVLIDGLGHANPPGSANPKRWQDAAALLEAGISVVATVDLGDLEGALPAAADPRRSLPEVFWRKADRLEVLDTPVEELGPRLARLRAVDGGGAQPDEAELAGLAAWRARALELSAGPGRPSPVPAPDQDASGDRVMVCLASLSPRGDSLLKRGESLARRLDTGWFVVHVAPPGEDPPGPDARLLDLARGRGAEVARLSGRDPVAALVDFARAHGVGHIVLGRSLRPWWRQVLGRSPMLRLVREAAGFDLHIVESADHGDAS